MAYVDVAGAKGWWDGCWSISVEECRWLKVYVGLGDIDRRVGHLVRHSASASATGNGHLIDPSFYPLLLLLLLLLLLIRLLFFLPFACHGRWNVSVTKPRSFPLTFLFLLYVRILCLRTIVLQFKTERDGFKLCLCIIDLITKNIMKWYEKRQGRMERVDWRSAVDLWGGGYDSWDPPHVTGAIWARLTSLVDMKFIRPLPFHNITAPASDDDAVINAIIDGHDMRSAAFTFYSPPPFMDSIDRHFRWSKLVINITSYQSEWKSIRHHLHSNWNSFQFDSHSEFGLHFHNNCHICL